MKVEGVSNFLTPGSEPENIRQCIACGHFMPLAVWNYNGEGICTPCRDAAESVRGPCSPERGCFCAAALKRGGRE